jgi:hypothetical protein
MVATRKVLTYIKVTSNFGIIFPKGGNQMTFYKNVD